MSTRDAHEPPAPDEAITPDEGLPPHRVREAEDESHDLFDENATYEDASRPGTVAAAADQPYLVKARQREEYAEAEPPQRHDPKASSPLKLTSTAWKYSLKRTLAEFSRDQCTDLAAALTYYAVLSVFPALIALVSILGLLGEAERVEEFVLSTVGDLAGAESEIADTVQMVLGVITPAEGAGLGLAIGILAAIWTASNYVNAFSRAMNRIWEVEEGRSFLQLRPVLYLVTVALIVLVALSAVMLVVSGPLAEAIGNTVGLGETAVTVWNWASPVVLILIAALGIGLLYFATPNIRQPGPKWTSAGAVVTILVMIVTTIGIAFYVMHFGNYDATYGALAGVIIFLFWIYIMNIVLLFGAELDSELERARQLQAGIEAERTIMLPPRQTTGVKKKSAKHEHIVAAGYALRVSKGQTSDPEELWRR
ncbi:YihY/virulence factor BrkB family protein [Nesterenkonia alba]|uniref:YihY/virulence factor BrkB family protein n=1 Tax=Nesterenkonia alba TaxID=515814 RepID=UPI0003B76BFA|nr:YihY/virulence factor BrkB family protein [Nesterenkonia alba]